MKRQIGWTGLILTLLTYAVVQVFLAPINNFLAQAQYWDLQRHLGNISIFSPIALIALIPIFATMARGKQKGFRLSGIILLIIGAITLPIMALNFGNMEGSALGAIIPLPPLIAGAIFMSLSDKAKKEQESNNLTQSAY